MFPCIKCSYTQEFYSVLPDRLFGKNEPEAAVVVQIAGVVAGFAALPVIEIDVAGAFDGAAGIVREENVVAVAVSTPCSSSTGISASRQAPYGMHERSTAIECMAVSGTPAPPVVAAGRHSKNV